MLSLTDILPFIKLLRHSSEILHIHFLSRFPSGRYQKLITVYDALVTFLDLYCCSKFILQLTLENFLNTMVFAYD